jgi:hypothetical protein
MNGERMPCRNRVPSDNPQEPLTKEELDVAIRCLDRAVRWNTFLIHVNLNAHDVIDSVTNRPINTDSNEFGQLRTKFADNVRSFKNKTLDRFVTHINELLEQETWLKDASDTGFKDRLSQKFNYQNWVFCFYYMKDYIDFEASSNLGKWYMENMYVNLGLETKRYFDAGETKDAREKLLVSYDAWALNEAFDDIDKNDFAELTERYRNAQTKKKRDFAEVNDRFTITRAPPKKGPVAQSWCDTRSQYSDDRSNLEAPHRGRGGGILEESTDMFGGMDGTYEVEYRETKMIHGLRMIP